MKLTTNNIRFVKELTCNGVAYEWHVAMKSGLVSDSRTFVNYDENGKTCISDYPFLKLPKAVQNFLQNTVRDIGITRIEEHTIGSDTFTTYTYKERED